MMCCLGGQAKDQDQLISQMEPHTVPFNPTVISQAGKENAAMSLVMYTDKWEECGGYTEQF